MKIHEYLDRLRSPGGRSIEATGNRGGFTAGILDALHSEEIALEDVASPLRVQLSGLECGNNPFQPQIRVLFTLNESPPAWSPGSIELSEKPLGVTGTIDSRGLPGGVSVRSDTHYIFRFMKSWGITGGMERFRGFVRQEMTRSHPKGRASPTGRVPGSRPVERPAEQLADVPLSHEA